MLQYKNVLSDEELMQRREKRLFGARSEMSMTGRNRVELCGCLRLLVYKDELIQIRLCDSIIKISGSGLTLKNYFGGRMIIAGRIDKTEYFECEA